MEICVFDTPEARRDGRRFERLRVLDESSEGILAERGDEWWVFLPWEYLARYGYRYLY